MKTTRSAALLLAFAVLTLGAGRAAADGHINTLNCSTKSMKVCVYDWDDGAMTVPHHSAWIKSGAKGGGSCVKGLFGGSPPGCGVGLNDRDSCFDDLGFRNIHSGDYTMWISGSMHYIRPGYAEDCNNGNPNQFTLEGEETSGCTPTLILYGDPEKKGDSYVIKNKSLPDMTKLDMGDKDLNDWTRAMKLISGRWRICTDTNYGGKCLTITGAGAGIRLDQNWSGNWDKVISSIKPIACE